MGNNEKISVALTMMTLTQALVTVTHRPNEASGPDFVDKVLARLRHTAHTLHPLEPKTASVHCSAALSPTHTSVIKIVVIFISTMTMDLTFYS